MTRQGMQQTDGTRRMVWVRPSQVPPIEPDETVLERKGVLAPMQADAPPFLLLGEDRFVAGAFPLHPHEGIETVTYVVCGALEHNDAEGNNAVVHAGGVQWMTAGRGIQHSEEPVGDEPVHGFQLWIDLPPGLKRTEPVMQMAQAHEQTTLHLPGGSIRIVGGTINDATGPITTLHPVTMAILDLENDADIHLDLDPAQAVLLFTRTGSAYVLGTAVPADHGAYLSAGRGAVRIQTSAATQILLYAAVPSVR